MGRAQRNPSSRDPGPAAQRDGFRLWLYPSYDGLAGVLAARRMGRAQRNPSSRDPGPAAQSDGFRLWLYPSYDGLAGVLAARRMGRAQRNPSSRDPGPAAQSDGFRLWRSEEHTYELQLLMRISYALFRVQTKSNISNIITILRSAIYY